MQKVTVQTLSDLSEEPDAHTVVFGFEGAQYEIDVTEVEHKDLAEILAPYIAVARKVAGPGPGRKKRS